MLPLLSARAGVDAVQWDSVCPCVCSPGWRAVVDDSCTRAGRERVKWLQIADVPLKDVCALSLSVWTSHCCCWLFQKITQCRCGCCRLKVKASVMGKGSRPIQYYLYLKGNYYAHSSAFSLCINQLLVLQAFKKLFFGYFLLLHSFPAQSLDMTISELLNTDQWIIQVLKKAPHSRDYLVLCLHADNNSKLL